MTLVGFFSAFPLHSVSQIHPIWISLSPAHHMPMTATFFVVQPKPVPTNFPISTQPLCSPVALTLKINQIQVSHQHSISITYNCFPKVER